MSGFSSGFSSGFGERAKGLILPDSRFEMPELFIPGEKPLGEIQLNLSNEFGRHVLTGICQGRNITRDLNPNDPLGTGGFELYSGATIVRDDVFCGANDSCATSRNAVSLLRDNETSFLFRGICKGYSPAYNYLLYCDAYYTFSFYFDPDDYWYVHSTKSAGTVTVPLNIPYSIVYSDEGFGNQANIYFSFTGTTLNLASTSGNDAEDIIIIGGRNNSNDRYSNHEIGTGVLLDKALSADEAYRWIADPYQLFEPA